MDRNEKQLKEEINRLLKQLETLIYNNYLAAINLFQVKNSLSGNTTPFWFSRNAAANKQMDKLIANFNKQAAGMFLNGIERSWKLGEENFIDKMHLAFSKDARQRKYFDETRNQATQQQRDQGAHAVALRFADQKRGGVNLSDRVWKLGNGMKQEIETIVQNGMKEGKTPNQLARELKKYLNEPDKLFRKVRNKETGEMELSEAAKKYKPGQGVYCSAHKNAMRLARTEIPAAYRRAQWEAFQTNPQVIGIRITLSNNHTCINPKTGKPEPFYDICDELAGDYPKSFLWTGWHPQCRCEIYPILTESEDEIENIIQARIKGETYEPKQIKKVPLQFQKWVEKNNDRINVANNRGTLPYWMKDNAKFAGITVNPINATAQPEIRKAAAEKYNAYGSDWEKAYFDRYSGGYNVYHKDHNFAKKGGGGEAEIIVGKMLAKYNGKQVEFLPEGNTKSPDVKFDGKTWDVKYIEKASEHTIRDAIRDARKADNAIFYFTDESKYLLLISASDRETGKFLKGQTKEIPDIYYMDKSGILKLLWEKQKGTK
ncbi:MAG: hypothetical protein LBR97_04670 [Dysgonamonadaceae bacterium]|jgi:hypothetical protein|nr:hypothetical protein [Dysgonamonadaceae bacterium]